MQYEKQVITFTDSQKNI